nr:reverse transcriptase domain-containing protein [Tanacetum cinerariifolium]
MTYLLDLQINFIDIALATLDTSYEVELADGKLVSTNTVLCSCTLALFNHVFKIDVLPTRLVRIPLPNGEILEIQSEKPEKDLKLLSCIKVDEKKPRDIRIVRYFPEIFPDDLPGLPLVREIEFRIDLILGVLLVTAKPFTLLTQKNKTYVWGDKQEEAFHILKEKLCNAPVLTLPDGPIDFVVYYDASNQGFRCMLMQQGKRWWIELLSDYECKIKYHPGKENVMANDLSEKERLKPRQVRAMSMTIQSDLKDKILVAQGEASKDLKAPTKWLRGLETQFERRDDGGIYFFDRIWIPSIGGIRKLIIDEAHTTRLTKSAHFLPIREDYKTKKLARIYINEIVARRGVSVSIISDCDGRFTSHLWQAIQKALGTRLDMSTTYHPQTDGQSEHTIQTLEDVLRACVMDFGGSWDTHLSLVEFSYNNSYHKSIKCAHFKALYGGKCRSPVIWAEVGKSQLIGPKIMQETTETIMQIKERLKQHEIARNVMLIRGVNLLNSKLGTGCYLKYLHEKEWSDLVRKESWHHGKELSLLGNERTSSKPSTHTFSPPHRLLLPLVELWGPDFL